MSERFYLTQAGVEALTKRDEAVKAMVGVAERLLGGATACKRLGRVEVNALLACDLGAATDQIKSNGPIVPFVDDDDAAQPATCGGCGAKACANPARNCGKPTGETPCDANGLTVYVWGRRIDAPPHRDAYANWAASSFAGVDLAGETPESKPGAAVADTVEKIAADIVHWWRANDPHNKGTIGDLVARLEVVLPKAAEPKPEPASHPDVIAQTAVDGDAQRRHGRQAQLIVSGVEVVEGLSDAYRESSTALQDRLRWSTNGKALRKLRDALAEFTTDDVGPVAVETEADRRIAQLEAERDTHKSSAQSYKTAYELLTSAFNEMKAEHDTRKELHESASERIRTLETRVAKVSATVGSRNAELDQLRAENATLKAELEAMRVEYNAKCDAYNTLSANASAQAMARVDEGEELRQLRAEVESRQATAAESSKLEIQLRDRIDTLTYERDDARRDRDNAHDALSDVEKGAKMTADRLAEMEESHASAVQALAYCIKGFAILKAAVDAYKPGESSWSRVQIAAAPLLVHPDTAAAVAQVKAKVKAIQDDANDMVIRSPFESEMRTIALRLRANVANLA